LSTEIGNTSNQSLSTIVNKVGTVYFLSFSFFFWLKRVLDKAQNIESQK
jgi:hypothetical protein